MPTSQTTFLFVTLLYSYVPTVNKCRKACLQQFLDILFQIPFNDNISQASGLYIYMYMNLID